MPSSKMGLYYNMGQGILTYLLGVKILGLVPFVFQNVKMTAARVVKVHIGYCSHHYYVIVNVKTCWSYWIRATPTKKNSSNFYGCYGSLATSTRPPSFDRDFPSVHSQCHISHCDFSHSILTWHDVYLKKDNVWDFINFFLLSQDRDSQKTEWIDRCIEELRSDTWVLPALKQIKEICSLFYEVWLWSL